MPASFRKLENRKYRKKSVQPLEDNHINLLLLLKLFLNYLSNALKCSPCKKSKP